MKTKCPKCNGHGIIIIKENNLPTIKETGIVGEAVTCIRCLGTGYKRNSNGKT
jgi:hypothetical protein